MSRLATLIGEFVEAVTSATVGGEYAVTETETRRFDVAPALAVSATNGSIEVRGEDRADLTVEVTWRARDQAALESAHLLAEGGTDEPLSLTVEHENDASDVTVELQVRIPAETAVDTLETVNGSITLEDAIGEPALSTKNGSITVARVEGPLELTALNGSITVRESSSIRSVETKNGAIDVDVVDLPEDATVRTATGRIELGLAPSLDADLVCQTNVGSIEAPVLNRSSSGIGTTTVAGTIGGGGPELFVETNVGSIEVHAIEDRTESTDGPDVPTA
jgi:hypothetical protein